jgi:hypothetical protein
MRFECGDDEFHIETVFHGVGTGKPEPPIFEESLFVSADHATPYAGPRSTTIPATYQACHSPMKLVVRHGRGYPSNLPGYGFPYIPYTCFYISRKSNPLMMLSYFVSIAYRTVLMADKLPIVYQSSLIDLGSISGS